MTISVPTIDDRSYQTLLEEALTRLRVHTPEYTHVGESDPGVTIIETFAWMTENLLYRANQIPERNRRKFLSLLGVPLQPATPAHGLITVNKLQGSLTTETLNRDLEVTAKAVSFRTERGLDVLPIEARAYFKRPVRNSSQETRDYYAQLYASYFDLANATTTQPTDLLNLYETVPLILTSGKLGALNEFGANPGVNLVEDTVDHSLWIALTLRANDTPSKTIFDEARAALAGKTLSLGVVPWLDDNALQIGSLRQSGSPNASLSTADMEAALRFEMPAIPASGGLPNDPKNRKPIYRALAARAAWNVLENPGVVEITLPATAQELTLWNNVEPLEPGVDDMPPALEEADVASKIITWLRIRIPKGKQARLLWVGINATPVTQRIYVANELLGPGNGEPDQTFQLMQTPVVPGTVRVTTAAVAATSPALQWDEIDDLFVADPEVLAPDLRLPPGAQLAQKTRYPPRVNVFALDAESGVVRFGDGVRGRRPPFNSTIRASYAYCVGRAGNVGAGQIDKAPALPNEFKVENPVRTWGGTDTEGISDGEKGISQFLQHRDRLVSKADFETIVRRTPGIELGRLDVLPTYHPDVSAPGHYAPGVVTMLVLPQFDLDTPDAPQPDHLFCSAIANYLEPRRLVTTEIILRGPTYRPVFVALGIEVIEGATGSAFAEVREAVQRAIRAHLSPYTWKLGKPVLALELAAVASRVEGVLLVRAIRLAGDVGGERNEISMSDLELPLLAGLSVALGDAAAIDELRGQPNPDAPTSPGWVAIPVIPQECQ